MVNLFKNLFTKRSITGTLLLLILIGEPTVGAISGLFSPGGLIIFFFLYFVLFHLFESLIYEYHLVVYQVIFLTFAIYSVLITGFFNKELTEYVLNPNPFITLIRIQASFFVAFTFYLLNKIVAKNEMNILSFKKSVFLSVVFILVMSLTGQWGLPAVLNTIKTVPILALFFILLAALLLYFTFKFHPQPTKFESKIFTYIIVICLVLGAIPSFVTFVLLLLIMVASGVYVLLNKTARNHQL